MFFMGLIHIPMSSSKFFRGIGNSWTLLALIKVFTLIYTLYTQMSFYSNLTNMRKNFLCT